MSRRTTIGLRRARADVPTVDEVLLLFERRGDSLYGGEAVTQLEHALQCAMIAENEGASSDLIAAALLHDVGHLLHDLPDDAPDEGVDDSHETSGHAFLRERFPPSVTEPVRLHVAAKRYLCAVEEAYRVALSPASVVSLELQGGPMSPEEVEAFDSDGYAGDALRLRRWDDAAKVPDLRTPSLEHFAAYLRRVAFPPK